jgi:hypothetical protein
MTAWTWEGTPVNVVRWQIKAKKTHTNTTLERIAAVRWARHRDIRAIKIARINVLYVIRKRIQTIKKHIPIQKGQQ